MKSSGFTLIELLISIAIIGILAAVLIPNFLAVRMKAYDTSAITCAKSIQTAEAIIQVDRKTYWPIGNGSSAVNRTTDGVDHICKDNNIFVVDRSAVADLTLNYTFDVWDRRGSKVITVTPSLVQKDSPGATAFSDTGANLP